MPDEIKEEGNGRLISIEARIKELEPQKDNKDVRKELSSLYAEKIKLTQPEQPKDFKIAEIWIKNDTVALDASPNFWLDKLRAIGILHYCEKIVDDFNPQDKNRKIISGGIASQTMNKINRIKNRIGGAFGGKK